MQRRAKRYLLTLFPEMGEELYTEMWPANVLPQEKIKEIKNTFQKILSKYKVDMDYEPPSLNDIALQLNISSASIQRIAIKFFDKTIYQELFPPKDLTDIQKKYLLSKIERELREWKENRNYKPSSTTEIADDLGVSPSTIGRYRLRYLISKFGDVKGAKVYEDFYGHVAMAGLTFKKLARIKKIVEKIIQNYSLDNNYKAPTIKAMAQQIEVGDATLSKYIMQYLTENLGKYKAVVLYTNLWRDTWYLWRYIGSRTHLLLNSIFTRYFKNLGIKYFSEIPINLGKRIDGFLLKTDKLERILNLNLDLLKQISLNINILKGIKAICIDYTYDGSITNVREKILKYQSQDILLLIVMLPYSLKDFTNTNSYLKEINEAIFKDNIKIIGINIFTSLFGYKSKQVGDVLDIGNEGNIEKLMLIPVPDRSERFNLRDLEAELKKEKKN
ncbi:MAG: helix-turn-helix transcriptional regulator [Promethearchaeota archaeon]